MKCITCGVDTPNSKFCSRSCSAKNGNKGINRRTTPERLIKKQEALVLRTEGWGYRRISGKINIPWTTVKSWVNHIKAPLAHRKHSDSNFRTFANFENIKSKQARREVLIKQFGHKCMNCGLSEWCGEIIPIEVHHIDGDNNNNEIINLQLLCNNCHALTPNFRNRKR